MLHSCEELRIELNRCSFIGVHYQLLVSDLIEVVFYFGHFDALVSMAIVDNDTLSVLIINKWKLMTTEQICKALSNVIR